MSDIYADILKARGAILTEPVLRPTVTFHHPKCRALATGDVRDCGCGGAAFRSPA